MRNVGYGEATPLIHWIFWYLYKCCYSENTSLVRENGPAQDTTWSSDGPRCITLQLDHFISAVNSSQHTHIYIKHMKNIERDISLLLTALSKCVLPKHTDRHTDPPGRQQRLHNRSECSSLWRRQGKPQRDLWPRRCSPSVWWSHMHCNTINQSKAKHTGKPVTTFSTARTYSKCTWYLFL